eukprot:4838966-Heterocapsa_arctica.AAC.3
MSGAEEAEEDPALLHQCISLFHQRLAAIERAKKAKEAKAADQGRVLGVPAAGAPSGHASHPEPDEGMQPAVAPAAAAPPEGGMQEPGAAAQSSMGQAVEAEQKGLATIVEEPEAGGPSGRGHPRTTQEG